MLPLSASSKWDCCHVHVAGQRKEKAHMEGKKFPLKNNLFWASLVAQWLRVRLPVQGTRVRALVQEDPTCRGATKPVHHHYWACALEPVSHNYWSPCTWSPCSATREATAMRSPHTTKKSSPHSPQLEKARVQQWRPNAAKNKFKIFFKIYFEMIPNLQKMCLNSKKNSHISFT